MQSPYQILQKDILRAPQKKKVEHSNLQQNSNARRKLFFPNKQIQKKATRSIPRKNRPLIVNGCLL